MYIFTFHLHYIFNVFLIEPIAKMFVHSNMLYPVFLLFL